MFSISPSSRVPLLRITSTRCACGSSTSVRSCSSWAARITAFSGVRSSWLMFDRKRVLASDAASALSFCRRSATVRSATLCSSSASPRTRISSSMSLNAFIAVPISSLPPAGKRWL